MMIVKTIIKCVFKYNKVYKINLSSSPVTLIAIILIWLVHRSKVQILSAIL